MEGNPEQGTGSDGERLLSLFDKQDAEFIVAHYFSDEELSTPRIGASRLVAEELRYLGKCRRKVRSININQMPGPAGVFRRLNGRLFQAAYRRAQTSTGRMGRVRQARSLGAITWVLLCELVDRVEALLPFWGGRKFIGGDGPALILFNQPFCIGSIITRIRSMPQVKLAVIEHNIEWKFYGERMGGGTLSGMVARITKWVELDNLRQADYIVCINPKDREALIRAGLKPDNIFTWMPQSADAKPETRLPPMTKRHGKRQDFIIGFVGTNYGPNILAVKEIVRMARTLGKGYEFRVFGQVGNTFCDEPGILKNVTFHGWVDDLESELSRCDAFINPKIGSDTGAEVKMFDYLRHGKPVLSTPEGARGFERAAHVAVMDVGSMPGAIRKMAGNGKGSHLPGQ